MFVFKAVKLIPKLSKTLSLPKVAFFGPYTFFYYLITFVSIYLGVRMSKKTGKRFWIYLSAIPSLILLILIPILRIVKK